MSDNTKIPTKTVNIGIDLDDVLADFMSSYAAICYQNFGKPLPGTFPVDWEWSNFDLTKGQMDEAWRIAKSTSGFWEKLDLEPGATPSKIKQLEKSGCELFFITARVDAKGGSTKDQSCNWLKTKIGLANPTVLVSYNKGPLAAALQLDYFIDDRPKNVLEIKNAVPSCKVFLKDSSHNQTFSHPDVVRIKDADEFVDIVLKETGLAIELAP